MATVSRYPEYICTHLSMSRHGFIVTKYGVSSLREFRYNNALRPVHHITLLPSLRQPTAIRNTTKTYLKIAIAGSYIIHILEGK